MKAVALKGKQKIEIIDIPIPEITEDEMLIQTKAASICGTDVRMYNNGYTGVSEKNPLILGHEFSGVIKAVGKNITGYQIGQRVAVAPNMGCGTCDLCASGNTHLCDTFEAFGINIPGGFAEYVRVPEKAIKQGNVTVLQDEITFAEAALVEPLSCVYNGQKLLNLSPGFDALIIGAGPIGIMHIMIAKLFGAGRVLLNDLSEERMLKAKSLFQDIYLVKDNIEKEITQVTGRGVDVCVIAAPAAKAQEKSLEYMNMNGKLLFFGGLPKDQENVRINTNLVHYKQLGIYGCTKQSVQDYRICSKLVNDKRIPLEMILSKSYSIDEFDDALNHAAQGIGLKHVIEF